MNMKKTTTSNWKNEQLTVFKKYIKNFKPGSVEYMKLDRDIKYLENECI